MKEKGTLLKRIALIGVVILLVVVTSVKYDIFYKSSVEELNLTKEQKLEDFVKENLSVYQLQYDLGYDKAFRDFITLNDSEGERVTVRLQKDQRAGIG